MLRLLAPHCLESFANWMKKQKKTEFDQCVQAIRDTLPGQERNMYAWIRDLLVSFLGYAASDIKIDTTTGRRGIPDLAVYRRVGIEDGKGVNQKSLWMVVEAKDEPDAFLGERSREAIFSEKAKYIDLETAWFVMVDPVCLVLRPVIRRASQYRADNDTVIKWAGLTEEQFRKATVLVQAEHSQENPRLQAFRAGNVDDIATIKLSIPAGKNPSQRDLLRLEQARNEFFSAMRAAAALLNGATLRALNAMLPAIKEIIPALAEFKADYKGYELHLDPFGLRGEVVPREARSTHVQQVRRIRALLLKNLPLSRLAVFAFTSYLERTNHDEEKALSLLASETGGLMLARIIMLRFLEDHRFFGVKKYLCNGGVKAFQEMHDYFESNYLLLLRQAYTEGSRIYAPIFNEINLDWIFGSRDPQLSTAIERVMFYLSFFDFATIQQDVLSGIYGRFLETSQRKSLGEHYTPPEIARYIIERINLKFGDKVLDPACGVGTFLVEAYDHVFGRAIEKNVVDHQDVLKYLPDLCGNDINPFSASVAQIQMLWHLLQFRVKLNQEFPELRITAGYNSLHEHLQLEYNEFTDLDAPEYAAVVGNPPYVRPERQVDHLRDEDREYFNREISAEGDLYTLFIYKALDAWCRSGSDQYPPGKLGFVLPLSFCNADKDSKLRALFAVGGRWKIIEIVDLELIAPLVFTADVVPIILIAEKRPATTADTIILRVADERCARFTGIERKHVKFDLNQCVTTEVPYSQAFAEDGHLLTRINPVRHSVLKKIAAYPTFADIAKKFWVKLRDNKIVAWKEFEPSERELKEEVWESRIMLRRGGVFRGRKVHVETNGFDVFKGENIAACKMVDDPVEQNIDVDKMSDASLWRFRDILPKTGYAFHQVNPGLTCAPFSPAQEFLLDTATLFFPRDDLASFPFDFLVLSNLYLFYFGVLVREGVIFRARCHVYPRGVRKLPWSDCLADHQADLATLRDEFLTACQGFGRRPETLGKLLEAIDSTSFKDAVLMAERVTVAWSEELSGEAACKVERPTVRLGADDLRMVTPGEDLLSWININDDKLAQRLIAGLRVYEKHELTREDILRLPIPTLDSLSAWDEIIGTYERTNFQESVAAVIRKLDKVVGLAFGLSQGEVDFVQAEMASDPMLRRIKPNLPFAERVLRGLRAGLDSSDRFDRAYKTRG